MEKKSYCLIFLSNIFLTTAVQAKIMENFVGLLVLLRGNLINLPPSGKAKENNHSYTRATNRERMSEVQGVHYILCFFLDSVSSAAALVFYLPGVCTHTDIERKQSPEYFKIFEKNTIFNEHPVLAEG